MREADIQVSIIRNLEKQGWYVVKIIQSTKNGWPDLQAVRAGVTVYIEVKAENGKLSALQKFRHKELTKAGAIVYVTSDKNFTL